MEMNKWQLFSYEEFKKKVDLTLADSSLFELSSDFPDAVYAYHDGPLLVESNLELEEVYEELNLAVEEKFGSGHGHRHTYGVWIAGDLRVGNAIITRDCEDLTRSFVVEGDVSAQGMVIGGISVQVLGALKVEVVLTWENAEASLISKGPFPGRLYRDQYQFLIRTRQGKLLKVERKNCMVLQELLVPDVIAPDEEFNLEEDDYFDLTYLYDEEAVFTALVKKKQLFVTSP